MPAPEANPTTAHHASGAAGPACTGSEAVPAPPIAIPTPATSLTGSMATLDGENGTSRTASVAGGDRKRRWARRNATHDDSCGSRTPRGSSRWARRRISGAWAGPESRCVNAGPRPRTPAVPVPQTSAGAHFQPSENTGPMPSDPIEIQAAVCRKFGEPLSIETLRLDPPAEGEVRVRVLASSICHSDVIYMDGGWGGRSPGRVRA